MEENKKKEESFFQSLKKELMSKKVGDVGVFTIKEKDPFIIRGFKNMVNYTIFGFVMFMTFIILLISFIAF